MEACGGAAVSIRKINRLDNHGCEKGVRAEGRLATVGKLPLSRKSTCINSDRRSLRRYVSRDCFSISDRGF
jgi:hypothetical protein